MDKNKFCIILLARLRYRIISRTGVIGHPVYLFYSAVCVPLVPTHPFPSLFSGSDKKMRLANIAGAYRETQKGRGARLKRGRQILIKSKSFFVNSLTKCPKKGGQRTPPPLYAYANRGVQSGGL